MNIFLYIFSVALFILFLAWYYYTRTRVYFPSVNTVYSTIKNSAYLRTFSHFDYKVRKTMNKRHLLGNYRLYLTEATPRQKDIITFYCKRADDELYKRSTDAMLPEAKRGVIEPGLYRSLAHMNWNIILFSELEENMPHTHGEYILLPKDAIPTSTDHPNPKFVNTLIHEKLHVLQRLYPAKIQSSIKQLGFTKITKDIYLPDQIQTFRRKNPDFDNLYLWNKRYISLFIHDVESNGLGDARLVLYDTKRYISLQDDHPTMKLYRDEMKERGLNKDYQIEHPYEIMAYLV
jgi:hypothetical protein